MGLQLFYHCYKNVQKSLIIQSRKWYIYRCDAMFEFVSFFSMLGF